VSFLTHRVLLTPHAPRLTPYGAMVVSVPGSSVLMVTVTSGSEFRFPELAYQIARTTTMTRMAAAIRVPRPTRPSSMGLVSLISGQYPTLRWGR